MINLNIPRNITPGDTYIWRDSFVDYKPTEYSLSWAIRGASILNLNAARNGDEFETTLSSTLSLTLLPGAYFFQAYVRDNAGNRFSRGSGEITVGANLESLADNYDGSSTAQKMLSLVEAAIKARLEGGAVDSYEIRGRRLDRTPLNSLVALRIQLRLEVAREQSAQRLMPDARRLWVRFGGQS